MPRSHYIYLVRYKGCNAVLAAFTVKHEAVEWALRESRHPLGHLQLSSIKDGVWADKTEKPIPWETTGPDTSSEPASRAARSTASNSEVNGSSGGHTASGT